MNDPASDNTLTVLHDGNCPFCRREIAHLLRHGGPEGLLPLLQRCQADERPHRDGPWR
jgi:predicted DCC family thiol-disulfide oxidoreductase YuxK